MIPVTDLDRKILVNIVERVQAVLWLEIDQDGQFWNPDKEWKADTLDLIGEALTAYNLRPDNLTPIKTFRRRQGRGGTL